MTKILIVDEAEIFLKLERSLLRRSGFDLFVAGDSDELVGKASQNRPDLVLLHSKGQGERCGIPCARRLKADPATAGIPVILIRSGEALPAGTDLPCDRVLDEPVGIDELLEAISSLTGLCRRIQPRVPASLSVEIRSEGSLLRGRTKDVSSSGLFVLTRQPLETGMPVSVEVSVPGAGGASTVIARGVVVRGVPDNPASYLMPGNAVRLLGLDEGGRRTLDEFIELQGEAR